MAHEMKITFVDNRGMEETCPCDSVRLPSSDGLVGIRQGHVPTVVALSQGKVIALMNGETVFQREISGGFAFVENNITTVVAE